MKTTMSKSILTLMSLVFLSACAGAYASHHGDRAGRYNNVPYNNNYYYNNYHYNGAYIGRPYRRF